MVQQTVTPAQLQATAGAAGVNGRVITAIF